MAKQKRSSNKLLYWLIGAAIVLLAFFIIAKSMGIIGNANEREVEMALVKKEIIVEKVSASGTVQPVTEIKLAPEVSGEIRELYVEEGDSVYRGMQLVKIRPDIWESQLERAKASLSQQQANLLSSEASYERSKATFQRAKRDYERQEQLWNKGENPVISQSEWDLAQQNFKVAENDLLAAEQAVRASRFVVRSGAATVNEAEDNVRLTLVTAPMNGVISKLDVKKGERVVGTQTMSGTEMMRIADLNLMEVRVDVNENDIVQVTVGDTAIIDVDAYASQEKTFKGIVTLIANTAKEKTSNDAITEFEVRILILRSSYEDMVKDGNKFPFRPGMTASVEILTETKKDILAVPLASVTTRNPEENNKRVKASEDKEAKDSRPEKERKLKDKVVIFVNENGKAKMVEVTTGISDYDNIEILSGVKEGDEVITGPFLDVSKRLKDGDAVKKSKPEDKNKEEKKK